MRIEILPEGEPTPSHIAVPVVIDWNHEKPTRKVRLTFWDKGIWAISEAAIRQEIGPNVDVGQLSLLFSTKPRLFRFCGRAG